MKRTFHITIDYCTRFNVECSYFGVEQAKSEWQAIAKAERKLTRRKDIRVIRERRCEEAPQ